MDLLGYVILGVNDKVKWLNGVNSYLIDCDVNSCNASCCYLNVIGDSGSLINKCGNSCSFLNNNLCSAYDSRPLICRVYPFGLFFERLEQGELFFNIYLMNDCSKLISTNEDSSLNNDLINLARLISKPL